MSPSHRALLLGLLLVAAVAGTGRVTGAPTLKGDPVRGKAYFEQQCASCHADHLDPDGKPIGGMGPSLVGVVGRRSGPDSNNVILDRPTLDKYLADPDSFGSDVEMPISVDHATDRADVIAYLATLKMPKPDRAAAAAKAASTGAPVSPKP